MSKTTRKILLLSLAVVVFAVSLAPPSVVSAWGRRSKEFVHGIVINVDGEDYYLAGPPDGPGGATDIPGHTWIMTRRNRLLGKHYNTGPFGASNWWSSDAGDGELLYIVRARIDTWSPRRARIYAFFGYVHYHELVRVSDGEPHPTKVVWLKHIAVRSFTLDGGPMPAFSHSVRRGVDYKFIPVGDMPYP